jgi:hypothetical protein
MPWVTFRKWEERITRKQLERRNAQARAEWKRRIAERKERGG